MEQGVWAIRVKKRLCQALAGLRRRTCRKYVTLFFILIFSFFCVKSARAESVSPSTAQHGKTIVVRAIVPLTPEFTYALRKNSSLKLEKNSAMPEEEVSVAVRIAGGKDESLRNHMVRLQVTNVHGEKVNISSGKTDMDGMAMFSFVIRDEWLGRNVIQVADVTYGEPLQIFQSLFLIVYQTENELSQSQKIVKKSRVVVPQSTPGNFIGEAVIKSTYSAKSVTMETKKKISSRSRAGP